MTTSSLKGVLRRFDAWIRNWARGLSGQLVLSHVFVAAVVLAFALGVAQITFRTYLVRHQLEGLKSQAVTIDQEVMRPFFSGSLTLNTAEVLIHLIQGTFADRVYVYEVPQAPAVIDIPNGNVPSLRPSSQALAQVFVAGRPYRATIRGIAIIGMPVYAGPNNVAGGFFVESPLSSASSTANSLTRLLLFGEIGAIILVGALAYAIAGRLSGPLVQLRRVVAGSGRSRVAPNRRAQEGEGPAEVQALAHEFNRLEDRIETQMNQLKREADARDALMAHVAHDLRTPLTSIRGFLEAVQDGVAEGDSHDRAIEVAWEETLRLQRLVDRLLKATRIKSEGGPMAPLSTLSWVKKTLERVNPVLEQHQLSLHWVKEEDGIIVGNEDYLVEALLNLLDNAIKWAPAGSVIEVGSQKKQGHLVVSVRDYGPGIPEELLPRVFERFVTGDASRQQSSGLGLSIVDEVVKQHHGRVRISSRPGEGTMVELVLPMADDPKDLAPDA